MQALHTAIHSHPSWRHGILQRRFHLGWSGLRRLDPSAAPLACALCMASNTHYPSSQPILASSEKHCNINHCILAIVPPATCLMPGGYWTILSHPSLYSTNYPTISSWFFPFQNVLWPLQIGAHMPHRGIYRRRRPFTYMNSTSKESLQEILVSKVT